MEKHLKRMNKRETPSGRIQSSDSIIWRHYQERHHNERQEFKMRVTEQYRNDDQVNSRNGNFKQQPSRRPHQQQKRIESRAITDVPCRQWMSRLIVAAFVIFLSRNKKTSNISVCIKFCSPYSYLNSDDGMIGRIQKADVFYEKFQL